MPDAPNPTTRLLPEDEPTHPPDAASKVGGCDQVVDAPSGMGA